MDYEAMGMRIKSIRMMKGFTQKTAAEKIGISMAFFGLIERGKRKASIDTLVSICNALDVSVDEVLIDSLTVSKVSGDAEYEIVERKKMLSDAVKFLYEKYAE